ncbi:unnamed protein product [Brassica rapa subsp. trilocularis]
MGAGDASWSDAERSNRVRRSIRGAFVTTADTSLP